MMMKPMLAASRLEGVECSEGGNQHLSISQVNSEEEVNALSSLPGDAGQVGDHVKEVFVRHFAEGQVLWEGDDWSAILSSASWKTERQQGTIFFKLDDCLTAGW